MKRMLLSVVLVCLVFVSIATAQTTEPTTEPTGDNSTVNWFFVICETTAIIDLDGTMEAGFDLYIQVFDGVSGTGDALSGLLRVPVDGAYQVSQTITLPAEESRLLGQFASATIAIARESDPTNTIFETTVDDTQDGCVTPAYGSVDTLDAGNVTADGRVIIGSSGIFTPDGGVLNEIFNEISPADEPVVQIGARPSLTNVQEDGRVSDAGLIFAECDAFAGADPGLLYDLDNLTVFWSWFAATPQQVRDHINTAQYEVFLNSATGGRQTFPNVAVSPVVRREDGNYWVFYTANLGDGFKPGTYRVTYYVTWPTVISDGYEEFGPGTATPEIYNECTFDVVSNPFGIEVNQNNPTVPLQQ